jgi:hypothetical protein
METTGSGPSQLLERMWGHKWFAPGVEPVQARVGSHLKGSMNLSMPVLLTWDPLSAVHSGICHSIPRGKEQACLLRSCLWSHKGKSNLLSLEN